MVKKEIIYSGPPLTFQFSEKESLGAVILKHLENLDPTEKTQINATTGESMTNEEFFKFSKKIALGLETIGISLGDIVAVFGNNSFRNSAVATACFLLNAPFAPLDPSLRKFELQNILKQYQPKCVFCYKYQADDIYSILTSFELKIPIILLDFEKSGDSRFLGFDTILDSEERPLVIKEIKDQSKELALIVPSSGSTGIPKGVAFSHKSAIFIFYRTLVLSKSIVFLQTSHLFWLSGLVPLFSSYTGAVRVFLPKLDTENILDAVKKHNPAMTFLSPSELASIDKYPKLEPDALSPLKLIMVSGGPLNQIIVHELKKKVTVLPRFMHIYGITENGGAATHSAPGVDIFSAGVLDNGINLKIVDTSSKITLGDGEVGEIHLKHPNQSLGYVGNPEATKAAFDRHGWIKTGDLGCMKSNILYVTGRAKYQIKYRNLQISPTEIEHLLIGMEGILDVAVDGIPHEEDQYHAAALVVFKPDVSITEHDIHKYIDENMSPQHKLRGGIFVVDSIPKTTHNKVKRHVVKELILQLHKNTASN